VHEWAAPTEQSWVVWLADWTAEQMVAHSAASLAEKMVVETVVPLAERRAVGWAEKLGGL
jgi:hypothetical protein